MDMNKKIPALIIFIIFCSYAFAQPGPPGGPNCWPPPCIPIDGGISLFTILAALIGYRFYRKNK